MYTVLIDFDEALGIDAYGYTRDLRSVIHVGYGNLEELLIHESALIESSIPYWR